MSPAGRRARSTIPTAASSSSPSAQSPRCAVSEPYPARQVEVGELTIATTDVGEGPPLLLMHGNPDSRDSWRERVAELSARYRVIAPDFPGYGDSPEPPRGFDFLPSGQAALWQAFADAIGLEEELRLVVHDFGGPWLLPWLASQPERFAGLLVLNTPFQRDFAWHSWARVWQTPVLGELSTWVGPRFLFRREMRRGDPLLDLEHADRAHRNHHRAARRTMLRTYRAWADMDRALGPWEERLLEATAQVPTRVLWGARDPFIPTRMAQRFGVEPRLLPEAGHWVQLSAPAELHAALEGLGDR